MVETFARRKRETGPDLNGVVCLFPMTKLLYEVMPASGVVACVELWSIRLREGWLVNARHAFVRSRSTVRILRWGTANTRKSVVSLKNGHQNKHFLHRI